MKEFSNDDYVKMWIDNSKYKGGESYWEYGQVTIGNKDITNPLLDKSKVKVLFLGPTYDYWYYPANDLELVTEEEYRQHEHTQSERSS